jgi:hypothetical protein
MPNGKPWSLRGTMNLRPVIATLANAVQSGDFRNVLSRLSGCHSLDIKATGIIV